MLIAGKNEAELLFIYILNVSQTFMFHDDFYE